MGSSLFVVATLLLAVVGSSCGDGVPRDLSFINAMLQPYVTCSTGQLSCSSDCKKIQVCLGGTLEDVKTCPKGNRCDVPTMTCKNETEAECGTIAPDEFTCHGPVGGMFPNPYDCHSYFECPDPSVTTTSTTTTTTEAPATPDTLEFPPRSAPGTKHNCLINNTAYDALSTTCRFRDTHRVCKEGPVPACKSELQMGPLIENPNIYYVCVRVDGVLRPWLAKCLDPTSVFQDGQCVSSDLRRLIHQ